MMSTVGHRQADPPPAQVTRFYGNVDYALDVISNLQITFTHVSTLNDPFDPHLILETDFQEKRSVLPNYVKDNHPEKLIQFKKFCTNSRWNESINTLKKQLEDLKKTLFILSTIAKDGEQLPKDNLYMWSHYGNGHRGVAIEFDSRALGDSAIKYHGSQNGTAFGPERIWEKVAYCSRLPIISAKDFYDFLSKPLGDRDHVLSSNNGIEQYLKLMARVKCDVWRNENEWRLIWENSDTRTKIQRFPISADSVVAVYLGLNIRESAREDFSFEANKKFPKVAVYQAIKRHGAFALDFERLSLTK